MSPEAFATFSVCLEYLPNGTAPAWDAGCARFYHAALADVPDDAAPTLMKAVSTQFKFRPVPSDILAVYRRISESAPVSPDQLVADIYALRDRYGEYAVSSPDFPGLRLAGEPHWSDPVKRRIVAAMGGWVAFCRDESPLGVQRGQMLKIAQMVIGNADDAALNDLRLEYQEQRMALPQPIDDDQPPLFDSPPLASNPTSADRGSDLVRINSIPALKRKEEARS